jgi:hypothetical protein
VSVTQIAGEQIYLLSFKLNTAKRRDLQLGLNTTSCASHFSEIHNFVNEIYCTLISNDNTFCQLLKMETCFGPCKLIVTWEVPHYFALLSRDAGCTDVIASVLIWINLILVWCSVDAESRTVLEDKTNCTYTAN